jgi:O-acetylhomoserine/O-acetylserine sulfhydrylase-like pyridoxal-dependent enzyme
MSHSPSSKPAVSVSSDPTFVSAREISPRRRTTGATDVPGLVREQLEHFGVDPASGYGQRLAVLAASIYQTNADLKSLWELHKNELAGLSRLERVERFAAQKFLTFQLAKILDTLQHPQRSTYQSLVTHPMQRSAKGAYPIFDNITALFASRPVIARTATYIYACAEWVGEAFEGKEMLHSVYSRLLNPTSISLANQIVDVEAGELAHEYFAWNFNSGMAAVDATLSHLVGYQDIVMASRNVYGGTYQLMHDWYAKKSNLDVAVHFFDGYSAADFVKAYDAIVAQHKDRIAAGRQVYVYIESPCNPHGYTLDVPAICKEAHARGLTVICDSTVGTPFLHRPLQRKDPLERPDFVLHSYTKDIAGHGGTTAGVVIGRNARMFIPKHESAACPGPDGKTRTYQWDESLFWNVYYIKGAFLDADKAYEVLTGMHTLELRMLRKAVNTLTLAEVLASHPDINVKCGALPESENYAIAQRVLYLGLPAGLFTIDFEGKGGKSTGFGREVFSRFFDCLEPAFGHQVSLGQPNTVVLCPAITSHSEMSAEALRDAGITPTTIRIAVGLEDPRTLAVHLMKAAEATLERVHPGFVAKFLSPDKIDAIYRRHFAQVHQKYAEAQVGTAELMK